MMASLTLMVGGTSLSRVGDPSGQIGFDKPFDLPDTAPYGDNAITSQYVDGSVSHVSGQHDLDSHVVEYGGYS